MRRGRENGAEESREAPGKSRRSGFFSYVICAVAAVIIWLVIMNLNGDKTPPKSGETDRGTVSVCEIV